jgi:hypothetical protein
MARKKSYFSKSNRGRAGAVLANNLIASAQKAAKEKEKEAAAAKRKAAAAAEKERKRREREEEQARRKAAREAEQRRNEQKKLDEKQAAIAKRLRLDLEKMGLYPSTGVTADMAKEALEASVTPAKAKTYFIDGVESKVARKCAEYLLAESNVSQRHVTVEGYSELVSAIADFRPQSEALHDPGIDGMKSEVDARIKALEDAEQRQDERSALIHELTRTKLMFRDDIEDFSQLIEEQDLSGDDAKNSSEYQMRVDNKEQYFSEIRAKIAPFQL